MLAQTLKLGLVQRQHRSVSIIYCDISTATLPSYNKQNGSSCAMKNQCCLLITGIPDVPESVRALPGVTSIQLDWSPPSEYHGAITHYQVWYHCADNTAMSDISTDTPCRTLTGLRPETTCVMKVRAHTGAGAGDYSNTVTVSTSPPRKCTKIVMHEDGLTLSLLYSCCCWCVGGGGAGCQ